MQTENEKVLQHCSERFPNPLRYSLGWLCAYHAAALKCKCQNLRKVLVQQLLLQLTTLSQLMLNQTQIPNSKKFLNYGNY